MTPPNPARDEAVLTVDALAQEIRRVDGNHSLGAGTLAEALMPFLLSAAKPPASGVDAVAVKPLEWIGDNAFTVVGRYWLQHTGTFIQLWCDQHRVKKCRNEVEAKAAAQADYEQRIRSALSPAAREP